MTDTAAFTKAMDDLEHRATGKEKFELMHSRGTAKAELLKKLLNLYAIPWDARLVSRTGRREAADTESEGGMTEIYNDKETARRRVDVFRPGLSLNDLKLVNAETGQPPELLSYLLEGLMLRTRRDRAGAILADPERPARPSRGTPVES